MTPLLQTQEFSSENGNTESHPAAAGKTFSAIRGGEYSTGSSEGPSVSSAPEEYSLVNNRHLPRRTEAVYLSPEAFTMRASRSQPHSTNSDFDS